MRPAAGGSLKEVHRLVDDTSSSREGNTAQQQGGRGKVKRLKSTAGTTCTRVGAVNVVSGGGGSVA